MEAPVHLHQFAEMRAAFAPLPMLLAFAKSPPQTFFQHPAPQRFRMHFQLVFARQMLRRQGRPETVVFFLNLPQDLLALFFRPSAVGNPSRIAVFEARRSAGPVTLPQPLGLPVAHPE